MKRETYSLCLLLSCFAAVSGSTFKFVGHVSTGLDPGHNVRRPVYLLVAGGCRRLTLRLKGGHSASPSLLVDDEQDSLMGIADGRVTGDLMSQLVGLQRFDPSKAATWPLGSPAPLSFVSAQLKIVEERMASPNMRHKAQDTLCNLFRTLIVASPTDLVPLVCILGDQVLSATLAGVEILPATILMRAIAESSGKALSSVRSQVSHDGRNLAELAAKLQSSQTRLFQPPPLSLESAFSKVKEIAMLGGKDLCKRLDLTRQLLVAARGAEVNTLVRCLQGSLRRVGYSTSTIVAALAHAVILQPPHPSGDEARSDGAGAAGQDNADGVQWAAEDVTGLLHEALSHVPSLERVVTALMQHGPGGLMAALGISYRRGAGTRARKAKQAALQGVREDIEFEMAGSREGWLQAGVGQGGSEIELEELKAAAAAASLGGLPPHRLTIHEEMLLPAPLAQDASRALALRNHILLRYRRHVLSTVDFKPLSEEEACAGADDHNVEDSRAVFTTLSKLGYINHAKELLCAIPADLSSGKVMPRVIVVGAGFAGICSARSLKVKGFQVLVVEASDRIGGRVKGGEMGGGVVELGAMAITGSRGNPLVTLAAGTGQPLYTLRGGCTLYTTEGRPLPPSLDSAAERTWNAFLDAVPNPRFYTSQAQGRNASESELLPLAVPEHQEPSSKVPVQDSGAHGIQLAKPVATFEEMPGESCGGSSDLEGRFGSLAADRKDSYASWVETLPQESAMIAGSAGEDVAGVALEKHGNAGGASSSGKELQSEGHGRPADTLGSVLEKMIAIEGDKAAVGKSKLSSADQWSVASQALGWHMANLEYAIGAPLQNVSSWLWNSDDAFLFSGDHSSVPAGLQSLLRPLAEGLDVRTSHEVEEISYGGISGVSVKARGPGNEELSFDADFCVVTVPLGVLKDGRPGFSPPLPAWKTSAIEGMGFGLLNKVALVFDAPFWGEDYPHDYMGFLQDEFHDRGLCYMFCNLAPSTNRPILLALLAGEAAQFAEERSDESLVASAMLALRRAFPSATEPIETQVTRWGSDKFARGAYSFMQGESKAQHHEALAREIDGRIFFAGEHTCRTHPAQVVGALLSGVHAAGKIEAHARHDGHSLPPMQF